MYVIHGSKGFRIRAFSCTLSSHPNMEWIWSLFCCSFFPTNCHTRQTDVYSLRSFSFSWEQEILNSSRMELHVHTNTDTYDHLPSMLSIFVMWFKERNPEHWQWHFHVILKDSLSYRGAQTSLQSYRQPGSGDGGLGTGKESSRWG